VDAIVKPLCLILVLALSLPACARFSKGARQQRAYQKYVQKSMAMRKRQQSKISRKRATQQLPAEVGPMTESTTTDGPQAVPREQGDQ
jgi:hypothetical protein